MNAKKNRKLYAHNPMADVFWCLRMFLAHPLAKPADVKNHTSAGLKNHTLKAYAGFLIKNSVILQQKSKKLYKTTQEHCYQEIKLFLLETCNYCHHLSSHSRFHLITLFIIHTSIRRLICFTKKLYLTFFRCHDLHFCSFSWPRSESHFEFQILVQKMLR